MALLFKMTIVAAPFGRLFALIVSPEGAFFTNCRKTGIVVLLN